MQTLSRKWSIEWTLRISELGVLFENPLFELYVDGEECQKRALPSLSFLTLVVLHFTKLLSNVQRYPPHTGMARWLKIKRRLSRSVRSHFFPSFILIFMHFLFWPDIIILKMRLHRIASPLCKYISNPLACVISFNRKMMKIVWKHDRKHIQKLIEFLFNAPK